MHVQVLTRTLLILYVEVEMEVKVYTQDDWINIGDQEQKNYEPKYRSKS